jgi:uncharacterized membrane protein YagU involved in acid resistance
VGSNTVRGMIVSALRGAIAGAAAVWLMDLVTSALLERQSPTVTKREEAARPNDQTALVNLVDRLEQHTGVELTKDQRESLVPVLHYALGVVPGAIYGVFRRVPVLGSVNGVAYGLALWALNDEYLNSRLGLSAPFSAYPLETHWRGLVGHVVLGITTETGISVLGHRATAGREVA